MPSKYQKKGGNGGRRPGSGRKKRVTQVPKKIAAMIQMEQGNQLPHNMMMDLINFRDPFSHEKLDPKVYLNKKSPFYMTPDRLDRLMIACAPYYCARYAPIPYKPEEKLVEHHLDISKLDDEELEWARRITAKASVPVLVDASAEEEEVTL